MKLQIEANQQYQLDAVAAVADIFEGVSKDEARMRTAGESLGLLAYDYVMERVVLRGPVVRADEIRA